MPTEGQPKSKEAQIAELRAAISRAEKSEDEERVLLLEAQLRTLEKGEEFSQEKFSEERKKALKEEEKKIKIKNRKSRVLRDMQSIPIMPKDSWLWDGIEGGSGAPYEYTFSHVLNYFGFESFQQMVDQKAFDLHRELQVMDLFGGAYFLEDLENVSKIIGVRLRNVDKDLLKKEYTSFSFYPPSAVKQKLQKLITDERRTILEGNLYKNATWEKIAQEAGDEGFDLIVCRPEGPFGHSQFPEEDIRGVKAPGSVKGEIFVYFLERVLKLLSIQGGILFTQIPVIGIDKADMNSFWEGYITRKQQEGFEFVFGPEGIKNSQRVLVVTRNR